MVSHDREFVDNVVTSSLVFEGNGRINQFVGGYSDMKRWYDEKEAQSKAQVDERPKVEQKQSPSEANKPSVNKPVNKLSYKDKRELESLPKEIENMEEALETFQQDVNSAEFFQKDQEYVQTVLQQLSELEEKLSLAYERWDELESLQNNEQ